MSNRQWEGAVSHKARRHISHSIGVQLEEDRTTRVAGVSRTDIDEW